MITLGGCRYAGCLALTADPCTPLDAVTRAAGRTVPASARRPGGMGRPA
jgi:hypothetical protein